MQHKKSIFFLMGLLFLFISGCAYSGEGTNADQENVTTEDVAGDGDEATDSESEDTENVEAEDSIEEIQVAMPAISLKNYPKVDGSTATIPLAEGLIKKITGCSDVEAEESIDFSTTDPSYYALSEGTADLLLVYEPSAPTKEELNLEENYNMVEIGLDALVFIINEDNPVESLTAEQIQGIYSGEITNWKEVGGNDIEIVAFQRPLLSGSQTLMLNLMMQGVEMVEPDQSFISESMENAIQDVAVYSNTANAIGYSVYYYAKNMYTQPGIKFVAVDNVLPSNDSIQTREYGYTNPFYGVLSKDSSKEAENILNWLVSVEGQKLVEECGYVPFY